MLTTTIMDLLTALGLGLLVGLQKERDGSPLAGLKTFALATVLGSVAAMLAAPFGAWLMAAALLSLTSLLIVGNLLMMRTTSSGPGQTTEVALLLMYLVGALVVVGPREAAIVLGGTVAVLLHLREELKGMVTRLSHQDVRAIMQFVAISLVILPVLPDETYGPYDVLNPRQIWWMVVLIVGLNLAGYAAFRMMGARSGTALAGILGGVISSTATTISYARAARVNASHAGTAAVIIWIASGVAFVRILLEIAAVAPTFFVVAAGPISIMLVVFIIAAAIIWGSATAPDKSPLDPGNPSELKPAVLFAALYAGVLLVVAAAEDRLGTAGLFAAAALSGLTDVDAITLSTSQLVAGGRIEADIGWRLVLLAGMSNLAFKMTMAAALGGRALVRRLVGLVVAALLVGTGLLMFW